ncbi:hypothetical protein [Thiocystis violacea]|uniref:hypothetical protein n=1 Tax=Thiocystis violacea TaxID=13725 RepID=UPI001906B508|nr:hypothetical protein [Thiocystis violacea]
MLPIVAELESCPLGAGVRPAGRGFASAQSDEGVNPGELWDTSTMSDSNVENVIELTVVNAVRTVWSWLRAPSVDAVGDGRVLDSSLRNLCGSSADAASNTFVWSFRLLFVVVRTCRVLSTLPRPSAEPSFALGGIALTGIRR